VSINACSINEHTINSLCGRRRQSIIDWLHPTALAGGGSQQHVRADSQAFHNVIRRERPVFDENYEATHIQVSIEFMGQTYSQTIERSQMDELTLVTVSNFLSNGEVEESVNISDIRIVRVF
jgi:hypothetical protein